MTPTDPERGPSGVERTSHALDRAMRDELDRRSLEASLAWQDASAELTREIQASAPIDLGDVTIAIDRLEGHAIPSFGELENLLSSPEAGALRIEGDFLADLLREGLEGQTVLKRGIAFLKHRKYPSALEWWALNRRGLDPETSKLHLLLLVMEALTYDWAGDHSNAEAARKKVLSHPIYRRSSSHPPDHN